MSYTAIVAPAVVHPHPNADRLKLVNLTGYQVVTGADVKDGDLMVFFEAGGQLSTEMCYHNNEFRDSTQNKDTTKIGYFEPNRRVRTIRLRGQPSEGYAVTLEALAWTGANLEALRPGDSFTALNGKEICQKYVTPATLRAIANAKTKSSKQPAKTEIVQNFNEHYDTGQLRFNTHLIPVGTSVIFTEKLHGTSGRTGCAAVTKNPVTFPWWKRQLISLLTKFGLEINLTSYKTITGTRRVILQNAEEGPNGFYSGEQFRQKIHKSLEGRLHQGETLYYEIVGFTDSGAPLFQHNVPDDDIGKSIKKKYGNKITYSYGQTPSNCDIYVYRITKTGPDGHSVDLSWNALQLRCRTLGLKTVPVVSTVVKTQNGDAGILEILGAAEAASQGPSLLDGTHLREGVCAIIETPETQKSFKYKSFEFCHLEGIRKNTDDYVDIEEVS